MKLNFKSRTYKTTGLRRHEYARIIGKILAQNEDFRYDTDRGLTGSAVLVFYLEASL